MSAELSSSRALEGRLQQRLASSVPAAQLEEMAARLQVRRTRQLPAGSRPSPKLSKAPHNRTEDAQAVAMRTVPLIQIVVDICICRWLRRQLLMRRDRSLH